MNEDVPNGLGLFISIGRVIGIDVSIPQSIVALSSALLNKDLSSNARTIEYLLQKGEVSIENIKAVVS